MATATVMAMVTATKKKDRGLNSGKNAVNQLCFSVSRKNIHYWNPAY